MNKLLAPLFTFIALSLIHSKGHGQPVTDDESKCHGGNCTQLLEDENEYDYYDDDPDPGNIVQQPVNLTDFFITTYYHRLSNTSELTNENFNSTTRCFACYRLANVLDKFGGRNILANTCGDMGAPTMPSVLCPERTVGDRKQLKSGVSPNMPSACAKSYIRENTTELIIYGCYSPQYLPASSGSKKAPVEKSKAPQWLTCQDGFGESKGRNLSVYIWCCDNNLCNNTGDPNATSIVLSMFCFILFLILNTNFDIYSKHLN